MVGMSGARICGRHRHGAGLYPTPSQAAPPSRGHHARGRDYRIQAYWSATSHGVRSARVVPVHGVTSKDLSCAFVVFAAATFRRPVHARICAHSPRATECTTYVTLDGDLVSVAALAVQQRCKVYRRLTSRRICLPHPAPKPCTLKATEFKIHFQPQGSHMWPQLRTSLDGSPVRLRLREN